MSVLMSPPGGTLEAAVPLYEYRCEKRHRYESREPFGSPTEQPCQKCGAPAARVLHAPAIAFKGSGWYKTDSRGSNGASEASQTPSDSSSTSNGDKPADSTAKPSESARPAGKSAGKSAGKGAKAATD